MGTDGMPFDVLAQYEKLDNPALGRDGGGAGLPTRVELGSGSRLRGKGQQSIPPGDSLYLGLPGGGGHGNPFERDPARVVEDVAGDYVSVTAAQDLYGVVIVDGEVDEAATSNLRSSTAIQR